MNSPSSNCLLTTLGQSIARYTEKHIIIVVHAAPNTQPGGVHGALISSEYQVDLTPLPVKNPPNPKAEKLINKKITDRSSILKCMNKKSPDNTDEAFEYYNSAN